MTERPSPLNEIHVQPGESHLVREAVTLRTILGSCVGITFWAPQLNIAALCHPMLPVAPVKGGALGLKEGCRYVDFAIRDLAAQLDSLGAVRRQVQVKLFGGGDVLAVGSGSRPTVGRLNCEAALKVLHQEGFDVAASSLGGTTGVHIIFNAATGEVLLRRLG